MTFFFFLFHSADHSWSYVDDTEDVIEQKDDHNSVLSGSSVAMASDTSTAAALAACSDAQRGMDSINRCTLQRLGRF